MAFYAGRRLIRAAQVVQVLEDIRADSVLLDMESPDRLVIHRIDEPVASARSSFQQIDLFRTRHLGLVLTLDDLLQVAQSDERIYHELLIHPAALMCRGLASALVLGGGDGCAARELLKYPDVQTVTIAEIDETVTDLCRRHFTDVNEHALDDPRVSVEVMDAEAYLTSNPDRRFDLICADLTEPYDTAGRAGELSRHIFSQPFYEQIKSHVTPGGVVVFQTGGIAFQPSVDRHHLGIVLGLRESFQTVQTAYFHIPSFDQLWTVTLACDREIDPDILNTDAVRNELGGLDLKHYDALTHSRVFTPPKIIRDLFD